jgi:hypothetical protein
VKRISQKSFKFQCALRFTVAWANIGGAINESVIDLRQIENGERALLEKIEELDYVNPKN